MFPDVRLMIAAMVASAVALMCGFGIYATLRVGHEPLVRLPPATAPLQLVADNSAKWSVAFAPGEPFDHRFQISEPPTAVAAIEAPHKPDRQDEAEPAPTTMAATPDRGTAATKEATSVVGDLKEAASPTAELTEQQVVEAAAATASDKTPVASVPQPQLAPAATGDTAVAPQLPAAASQETGPPVAFEPIGKPAPTPAPAVAAIEPLMDPPLPPELPASAPKGGPAGAPSSTAETAHKTVDNTAAKRKRHTRVATRTHYVRRMASAAARAVDQYSTFSQPNFQAAAQASQPQWAQRRTVRIWRSKIASRKAKASNSASGGPFVSPPSH